jgi:hypothetical protein
MSRACFTFLAVWWLAVTGLAGDGSVIKFPSPDGHFALRMTAPSGDDSTERKVELIVKDTGLAIVDLGVAYRAHLVDTVLVWSADSKRVAYGTRDDREGEASVYFWNGTTFEEVTLPDNLPAPDIRFPKGADGAVKNYGGAVKPVRWLKSGELELSSDSMMLSRVDERSYTGTVVFTIAFDKQNHAAIHTVGKSKTHVDK